MASVCVCELGCAVSFSFSRSIDREFCPIDYIIRNACKITHIRESRKWKAILIFTLPKTGESHGHLGTSHPQLSDHAPSVLKKETKISSTIFISTLFRPFILSFAYRNLVSFFFVPRLSFINDPRKCFKSDQIIVDTTVDNVSTSKLNKEKPAIPPKKK